MKLYKFEVEILSEHTLRGFDEPIFTSDFQIYSKKLISKKDVVIKIKP